MTFNQCKANNDLPKKQTNNETMGFNSLFILLDTLHIHTRIRLLLLFLFNSILWIFVLLFASSIRLILLFGIGLVCVRKQQIHWNLMHSHKCCLSALYIFNSVAHKYRHTHSESKTEADMHARAISLYLLLLESDVASITYKCMAIVTTTTTTSTSTTTAASAAAATTTTTMMFFFSMVCS